jgi:hypothetical protein
MTNMPLAVLVFMLQTVLTDADLKQRVTRTKKGAQQEVPSGILGAGIPTKNSVPYPLDLPAESFAELDDQENEKKNEKRTMKEAVAVQGCPQKVNPPKNATTFGPYKPSPFLKVPQSLLDTDGFCKGPMVLYMTVLVKRTGHGNKALLEDIMKDIEKGTPAQAFTYGVNEMTIAGSKVAEFKAYFRFSNKAEFDAHQGHRDFHEKWRAFQYVPREKGCKYSCGQSCILYKEVTRKCVPKRRRLFSKR